jgi:hypothetical protein
MVRTNSKREHTAKTIKRMAKDRGFTVDDEMVNELINPLPKRGKAGLYLQGLWRKDQDCKSTRAYQQGAS